MTDKQKILLNSIKLCAKECMETMSKVSNVAQLQNLRHVIPGVQFVAVDIGDGLEEYYVDGLNEKASVIAYRINYYESNGVAIEYPTIIFDDQARFYFDVSIDEDKVIEDITLDRIDEKFEECFNQTSEVERNDIIKYTYVTVCRDIDKNGNVTPAYGSDDILVLFDTEKEAYDFAYDAACEEAEELCEGADEKISFGAVPEANTCITVNYYFHPDNNTEWVTKRIVRPVKV